MAADDMVNGTAPSGATAAVLKPSDPVPEDAIPVEGLDFNDFTNRNVTVAELVEKMGSMGFQASSIGRAAQIIDGMVGRDFQTFHGLYIRDS
jgi:deoxyhypusine synthase